MGNPPPLNNQVEDKFQEETGVSISWGSTLIALNAALMKPRNGFTPVKGKKNWGRQAG